MIKILCAAAASLLVASCGGGGDASPPALDSGAAAMASTAQTAPGRMGVVGLPVSIVNTDRSGDQVLRGIGSTEDGGFTVAWLSRGSSLAMQHHDSSGHPQGEETAIPLAIADAGSVAIQQAIAFSDVAPLVDGSVVAAYRVDRATVLPNGTVSVKMGVYLQRFDAAGAPLLAETTVASHEEVLHSRSPILSHPTIAPLRDGGFVVAWGLARFSAQFGSISTLSLRRYDAQAQPVGATVEVGQFPTLGFALLPDAHGGFLLRLTQLDASFTALTSLVHYDAGMAGLALTGPRTGAALALPLAGGYLLFASDGPAAVLQRLDGSGQAVGAGMPFPAVPVIAAELPDGSLAVVWTEGGSLKLGRFTPWGAALGAPLTLAAPPASASEWALLPESGFVLAWTQQAGSDLDVHLQRFLTSAQDVQKACRDAAKALKGREHQGFMKSCRAQGVTQQENPS